MNYRELMKDYPTAYIIRRFFNGDKEFATETAQRIIATHRHAPAWCSELVVPRGWRDTQGRLRF